MKLPSKGKYHHSRKCNKYGWQYNTRSLYERQVKNSHIHLYIVPRNRIYFIQFDEYHLLTTFLLFETNSMPQYWNTRSNCSQLWWSLKYWHEATNAWLDITHTGWQYLQVDVMSRSNRLGSAAYMRQWSGSALVQVMACRLFGTKPLPKPMLTYYQLDPKE